MVKRIGSIRRKTRHKISKKTRAKGKISTSAYFQKFETGKKVVLKGDASVKKGIYFPRFYGKIGVIKGKQGNCYKVSMKDGNKQKIVVRPFIMKDFDDIKDVLDSLREGYTIALINIKPLKEKDLVELKRAINKLKKTTDAIEGDIAGFGEDYIVVTPSFATVHRSHQTAEVKEESVAPAGEEAPKSETY